MNDLKGRLFAFHGCDRKVGTTMVAASTAKLLAKALHPAEVLFVALNGTDDLACSKDREATIETIKTRIDNGLMTGEEIMDICGRNEELYTLGGVSGVTAHRNYSVGFSQNLISRALDRFDVIVADCGNEVDCSLCVGCLECGGSNIMVMNQNETSLVRYEGSQVVYKSLGIDFDSCIINRYIDSDPHDIEYLRTRLGRDRFRSCHTIREEKNVGRLAEMDGKLIIDYRCPGYVNDVRKMAYELIRDNAHPGIIRGDKKASRGKQHKIM